MSIENETPTLSEVVKEAIRAQLLDLHVSLPAQVEEYNHAVQKAKVKPLVKKRYLNGTIRDIDLPIIPGVPVQWPSANNGAAYIHLPLIVGDLGIVLICERSIDTWLSGDGQIVSPEDPRHHDLSDAVFIPGVRPFKKALSNVSPNNLVIQNNNLRIELDPTGKISIEGASQELLTILSGVLDHLISAKVITALGPMPFIASTIANFTQDKTYLGTLIP